MKTIGSQLTNWAIHKIEAEYKDDICLLLEHNTLKLDKDYDTNSFSYYIPATSKANGLARTFIIDGIGYDLFPMSWERIERMADVKEYNTTCLADAKILYAKSENDRQRFLSLQARLQANLQNPHYMNVRALEWLDTVMDIYQEMLFEERIYKIREHAGYICDLLSIAVAFSNQRYFKHGQTNQIKELEAMENIPKDFIKLYKSIIYAETPDEQKRLCNEIIKQTKSFLIINKTVKKINYTELASWYQELCYTWRRVYHWCSENDPINAYIWCCMLQDEVEKTGMEYGISELDILGAFKANDLTLLQKRAEYIEKKFVEAIAANGVTLDSYAAIEDFLSQNS